jgi:hypothetical protein
VPLPLPGASDLTVRTGIPYRSKNFMNTDMRALNVRL